MIGYRSVHLHYMKAVEEVEVEVEAERTIAAAERRIVAVVVARRMQAVKHSSFAVVAVRNRLRLRLLSSIQVIDTVKVPSLLLNRR